LEILSLNQVLLRCRGAAPVGDDTSPFRRRTQKRVHFVKELKISFRRTHRHSGRSFYDVAARLQWVIRPVAVAGGVLSVDNLPPPAIIGNGKRGRGRERKRARARDKGRQRERDRKQ